MVTQNIEIKFQHIELSQRNKRDIYLKLSLFLQINGMKKIIIIITITRIISR